MSEITAARMSASSSRWLPEFLCPRCQRGVCRLLSGAAAHVLQVPLSGGPGLLFKDEEGEPSFAKVAMTVTSSSRFLGLKKLDSEASVST